VLVIWNFISCSFDTKNYEKINRDLPLTLCLQPQVGFPQHFILHQFVPGTLSNYFTRRKDIIAVGHGKKTALTSCSTSSTVIPILRIAPIFLKNLFFHNRRQAGGGFINTQKFGVGHQSPAKGQHLLLTAGQGAGYLFNSFLKSWKQ
jgi:hypothetical protein